MVDFYPTIAKEFLLKCLTFAGAKIPDSVWNNSKCNLKIENYLKGKNYVEETPAELKMQN